MLSFEKNELLRSSSYLTDSFIQQSEFLFKPFCLVFFLFLFFLTRSKYWDIEIYKVKLQSSCLFST